MDKSIRTPGHYTNGDYLAIIYKYIDLKFELVPLPLFLEGFAQDF